MAREINRSLGRGSRVAIAMGEQPYLYVSLSRSVNGSAATPNAGGAALKAPSQWLQIPLDRVDPPLTTATLAGWLVSLGALLLVAVGFSWHITRPMTQLVRATDQLAAGRPERVVPSGPIETRRLGERFNAMLSALEQSERSQRTLLAGLPHDLKGPLSRMALRIEMADDPELKQGLKRDLADMQRMVEQFLAYIRGQDMGSLKLELLRLDTWLGNRIDDMQRFKKPVSLVGPMANVTVRADIDALDRLLTNLLDNALEHGGAPVEIELAIHSNQAVLSVSDHGAGIAPEDRQRALEPFARLDKARTRTGSVGLGLSVVQAVANAHGGSVCLDQAPSGGLRVSVSLPIMRT
jgi:two-component system osmolarity sensor histidine kinase EnvZ